MSSESIEAKVVVLGNTSLFYLFFHTCLIVFTYVLSLDVGKTSLAVRYCQNMFYDQAAPTVGGSFLSKNVFVLFL